MPGYFRAEMSQLLSGTRSKIAQYIQTRCGKCETGKSPLFIPMHRKYFWYHVILIQSWVCFFPGIHYHGMVPGVYFKNIYLIPCEKSWLGVLVFDDLFFIDKDKPIGVRSYHTLEYALHPQKNSDLPIECTGNE